MACFTSTNPILTDPSLHSTNKQEEQSRDLRAMLEMLDMFTGENGVSRFNFMSSGAQAACTHPYGGNRQT